MRKTRKKRTFHQGEYEVKNRSKYSGVNHTLKFRSSYELRFMQFCDKNPAIIAWNYEQFVIKYVNPMKLDANLKPKTCRYILDFWINWKDKEGITRTALVEIKPYNQVVKPVRGNKRQDVFESAVATWNTNMAKWAAATEYCRIRNWEFKIFTERSLFG